MRGLRYILVALFMLCYRGLSAQEFDLYDFRYYKRFETVEELLAPETTDSLPAPKFTLNRDFSTRMLDYNLSMVRNARRGVQSYRKSVLLNGLEMPFIANSSVRALQLTARHTVDKTLLNIDTLSESKTSAGFAFTSRNMPYSLSFSTSQRLPRNWHLSANMVARTGRDLHIDGIFGNSLEFDVIASKLLDKEQMLSFALFVNPSMRSSRLASTKEAFRLTGNNLYNPAWGYQSGKVRSAHIRREFLPTLFIGYESRIGERTKLLLSAATRAGIERYSSLDWFDARTAVPDNYRYMPSYFVDDDEIFAEVEQAWVTNNSRYTQIDFDRLIASNRLNNGRAIYAVSDRVRRTINASLRGEATTTLNNGSISYGIEAKSSNCRNYKQMRDLLGAEYIIDLDYFLLDDDTYSNSLQNNLENPNRRIEEGDCYGYNYAMNEYEISLFGVYHYHTSKLELDIAAKLGYADISRRGFYRKELFADNSLGTSRHLKYSPYAVRISADYLISDNHFLRGSLSTEATPCDAEELFLQSKYNNRIVDNPTMRTAYGAELQYMFQRQNMAVSATLFANTELNDMRVQHIYDDLSGEYADIVTNNLNYLRYGLEVEAEYRFAINFRASAAVAVGRYKYATNSHVSIYSDTANIIFADHVESRSKGLSLGNMPQVVATVGLSYYNRGWWAMVNANYAGFRYIEPSLIMRTERVLSMATSPEQRSAMVSQERLCDAFTINISLSKSLYLNRISKKIYNTAVAPRFEDKYPRSRFVFRVGIRNLLGSNDIVYNGYESSRLQRYKLAGEYIYNRQASRYRYSYPRTFYASATFAF